VTYGGGRDGSCCMQQQLSGPLATGSPPTTFAADILPAYSHSLLAQPSLLLPVFLCPYHMSPCHAVLWPVCRRMKVGYTVLAYKARSMRYRPLVAKWASGQHLLVTVKCNSGLVCGQPRRQRKVRKSSVVTRRPASSLRKPGSGDCD